jgi:hypothetical protein
MPIRNLHLMTRSPILTVLFLSALQIAGISHRLRAAPPDPSDGVKTADGESPTHTSFSDIVQAGAKIAGKTSAGDNGNRVLPEVNAKGTSSSTSRKAALAALPLDQLTPENRQKVNALTKSVSFYRRLPTVTFPVEPDVYNYFISHPDAAVSIWRAMKISKLQMWQTGRFDYEADTGDGSVGTLEILHIGPEKSLVACDGIYKSPLFTKPIEAKSLLMLQTSFSRNSEGVVHVTHRAELFVTFPSQTIDVVSRIFSPLTVSMTDRTFTEISLFLKMMSLAMARRPDWVEQIADKMDGVADLRKEQVLELSAQVHAAALKRTAEQSAKSEKASAALHEPGRREAFGPGHVVGTERRSPTVRSAAADREEGEKPAAVRVISDNRRQGDGE